MWSNSNVTGISFMYTDVQGRLFPQQPNHDSPQRPLFSSLPHSPFPVPSPLPLVLLFPPSITLLCKAAP